MEHKYEGFEEFEDFGGNFHFDTTNVAWIREVASIAIGCDVNMVVPKGKAMKKHLVDQNVQYCNLFEDFHKKVGGERRVQVIVPNDGIRICEEDVRDILKFNADDSQVMRRREEAILELGKAVKYDEDVDRITVSRDQILSEKKYSEEEKKLITWAARKVSRSNEGEWRNELRKVEMRLNRVERLMDIKMEKRDRSRDRNAENRDSDDLLNQIATRTGGKV